MYAHPLAGRNYVYYPCHQQFFSICTKTGTAFICVPSGVNSNNFHYMHCYVLLFKNPLVLLPVSADFLSGVCPGFGQRRQAESEVLLNHPILTIKIVLWEYSALIEGVQE